MPTQDELIAQHLQQALDSGEIAGVKGFGEPLPEDAGWDATPAELRMPFKILKNAGLAPPEIEWFHERAALIQAIASSTEPESTVLREKLSVLEQMIALRLEALRVRGSL